MLSNTTWITRIATVIFLLSIFTVTQGSLRDDFLTLIFAYTLAFIAYLVLLKQCNISFTQFAIIAISAQLLSMLFEPNLSNDYYRFLWDGEMTWNNINPFDYKPNEVIGQPFLKGNEYLHSIYKGMSELSRRNYSCYPTINQSYFIAATSFSSSIPVNTFLLKLLILFTEVVGAFYLYKIFKVLNIPTNRLWILFLNPLWIIECTGNTHFEGVMISFLFIAFYYIIQNKTVIGASWFAIAVQIKLLPLMFIPFFLRYLGWTKMIVFFAVIIGLSSSIGLIQLNSGNIQNFSQSLALYVQSFEFNSIYFYNALQYGKSVYGWIPIKTYGPLISKISLFFILVLALWGNINSWKKLCSRLTVALFIYLLLTSTVHPWYIIPMLAISLFTNYSFPVIWSFLVFFTYLIYSIDNGSNAFESRLLISIEYALVLGVFLFELIRKRPLIAFLTLGK